MLSTIANIERDVDGITFKEFAGDHRRLRAVAFDLIALGEADSQVAGDVQQRYPSVPWGDLRAMRNKIAQQYFRVDAQIVWDTATQNLPTLAVQLRDMLDGEG
jgi:uncharacterized protein with HEPN domain